MFLIAASIQVADYDNQIHSSASRQLGIDVSVQLEDGCTTNVSRRRIDSTTIPEQSLDTICICRIETGSCNYLTSQLDITTKDRYVSLLRTYENTSLTLKQTFCSRRSLVLRNLSEVASLR